MNRFSPRVVESLISALANATGRTEDDRLELFGHSGGGTLAVLLARRIEGVDRVVTLAGNLDHRAWSKMHGYSPLEQSLNPTDEGPLPRGIVQLHLVGELDRNIPPELVERAAPHLGDSKVQILPGVTHACCWEASWHVILADH
jgi:pimeloyl-ACP methyl ester carboxylesterase